MNLLELVKLKNAIDEMFQPRRETQLIENILSPTYDLITNTAAHLILEHWRLVIPELQKTRASVNQSLIQYHDQIDRISSEIDVLIKQHWPDMFAKSSSDFATGTQVESIDPLELSDTAMKFVDARVKVLGDWRRPGMIIRPGREPWIRAWVSYDPLYLLDTDVDFIAPAVAQWNPAYQSRLRTYVIREPNRTWRPRSGLEPMFASHTADHLLKNLPQNQFDACLVYNFFQFKNADLIDRYLRAIFKILAPGGRLLCTINDCDKWEGVQNAVNGVASFTPRSWFLKLAQDHGYQVTLTHEVSTYLTWLELQKPGLVEPLRAGQTLAKIMNKLPTDHSPGTLDNSNNGNYTKEEIEHLIETAINLNIDTAYNCRYNYSPKQLAKLIKRRMKQS